MMISKKFTFEASHILPKHPGKCSRLHGHSWGLIVSVEGQINPDTGFVVDYGVLGDLVKTNVIDKLDHSHLGYNSAETYINQALRPDLCKHETSELANTWIPYFGENFYPSSENLCRAIFKLLKPLVKELGQNVRLSEVRIAETCTSEACYRLADEPASAID